MMAGRPIRSALFVDTENVTYAHLSKTIPNWMAWLEHGQFDKVQRRRNFVVKKAYWNPLGEAERRRFEAHGIDGVMLDQYTKLKNTADMHMAVEIIDLLHERPDIEEFVVLSRDTDFIPVIQRLRSKGKLTASLVDFSSPVLVALIRDKVDIMIPHKDLILATNYRPPKVALGLLGRWRARFSARRAQARREREASRAAKLAVPVAQASHPAAASTTLTALPAVTRAQPAAGKKSPPKAAVLPNIARLPGDTPIEHAAKLLTALLRSRNGTYAPEKLVMQTLGQMLEFTSVGPAAFLGAGTYPALLHQLADYDPHIKVDTHAGGHAAARHLSQSELRKLKSAASPPKPKPIPAKPAASASKRRMAFPPAPVLTPEQTGLVAQVGDAVRKLGAQSPGAYLPRKSLMAAISAVPGVSITPPTPYLGLGSLANLMLEVARTDPHFLVTLETGNGQGLRYYPDGMDMPDVLPAHVAPPADGQPDAPEAEGPGTPHAPDMPAPATVPAAGTTSATPAIMLPPAAAVPTTALPHWT
jgi:hypothetical protein